MTGDDVDALIADVDALLGDAADHFARTYSSRSTATAGRRS